MYTYKLWNKIDKLISSGKIEQGLALAQNDIELLRDMGCDYIGIGKDRAAMAVIDHLIQVAPFYNSGWFLKGLAFSVLGNYEESIPCYEKGLLLSSKDALSWCFLGEAYYKLGRYSEAIPYFDKAVENDPNLSEAWEGKAKNLLQLGKFQEAINCCKETRFRNWDEPEVWVVAVEVLEKMGRYNDALKAVKFSSMFFSGDPEFPIWKKATVRRLKKLINKPLT